MPNINDAFPSNYVKASDLRGTPVAVTVDKVLFEPIGQTREMKPVLYFIGKQKGMVLNKTNGRKITEISGSPLTEDWHGTAIVLYPTETEYQGETVECIRVKPVAKGARPAPTNTARQAARPAAAPPPQPVPVATVEYEEPGAFDGPLTEDDIPF